MNRLIGMGMGMERGSEKTKTNNLETNWGNNSHTLSKRNFRQKITPGACVSVLFCVRCISVIWVFVRNKYAIFVGLKGLC